MECKVSELVKRGHDQAAELKSSCGAVDVRDVAQLISDLATQLDVQMSRSNALAAENAGMKHAMAVTLEHVSVTDAGQTGVAAMIINDALHHSETPATDALLAELRAQGVEQLALHMELNGYSNEAAGAREYAANLRKGVQS